MSLGSRPHEELPMQRFFRSILMQIALASALFALFASTTTVSAQIPSITGRVVDERSRLPVAAAEVAAADAVTLTLQDGTYALFGVPPGPVTLQVRRVGYREVIRDVTAPVDGNTFALDLAMRRDALALDDRVRTGTTDGASRRELGFSVTTIHAADAAVDAPPGGWQDLLTARTPGLRFTRLSGNLGTGSPFTLRSISSLALGRTQPLIYVDGVRVNNDPNVGPAIGGGRSVNALDDLSVDDVESVEILRGPAATSLYGTEGASGVIHVLTKRGAEGPPRFTVSARSGANYLPDPADRVGAMWACPYDQSPSSAGGSEIYFGVAGLPTGSDSTLCNEASELFAYNMYEEANEYIREGYFAWPTTNLYQDGPSQDLDLEVRGGSRTVGYYLSTSYEDSQGFVHFNTDEAFRMRGNLSIARREGLQLDISTGYANGFTHFGSPVAGDGGEWQDLVWSNGTFLSDNIPFGTQVTQTNGTVRTIGDPRLGGFQEKLPSDVPPNESSREYDRFTGSASLRFQSGEFDVAGTTGQVSQRLVAGIDKGWDINQNIFPLESGVIPAHLAQYYANQPSYRWKQAYPENALGTAAYERPVTTNVSLTYGMTADLELGDAWATTTSVGLDYHVQERDHFQNAGTGFTTAVSRTINQISQSNILTGYSLLGSKSVGGYVQQQVGFRDRVFVAGALRMDDNSTFGDRVGTQTYPSVSASWTVSDESFWPVAAVGTFRVRGAWGKAGRQPSPLSNESTFVSSSALGSLPVVRPATLGNPDLLPEVTSERELGLDVSVLDDRIAASFTRFWRTTEGAILEVEVPTSGFPSTMSDNIGRIGGWGWEAELRAEVFESDWMSADVHITADHVGNEIEDLGGYLTQPALGLGLGLPYPHKLTQDLVADAWWDPAGPVTTLFGRRVSATCDTGVSLAPDPSAPNAARYGRLPGGTAAPCQSTPDAWISMGPAYATHTISVAPRLRFFNDRLHVFALAEGQYGRWGDAADKEWTHRFFSTKVARLQDDAAWVYGRSVNDDTTLFLYDASFWRMREIGVRYELPGDLIGLVGVQQASISFSARNRWIIWQAQKRIHGAVISDPEFGAPSLDGRRGTYEVPAMASAIMTLRVTF
jgi:TonB-dependent SusC/RagA subfamily outer membrane receptor